MTLLNPLLLYFGLVSISVPIIIHLLNRRRFERVVWAAMRFVQLAVQQNQRRIQVQDMLLLLLRCLMLLVLAMALSRIACRSGASAGLLGQSSVSAVFVLDNSYSMSCTDGVRSRFDQAKDAIVQVIPTLPSGSSAAVILASDIANAVIPEPTSDLNLVRRVVHEARLSDRGTNLFVSLRAAVEILKGRAAAGREIYLFTDGQNCAWKQLDECRALLEQARTDPALLVRVHLVFVGAHEDQNLGVSALRSASGMAAVNWPLRYEVEVTNYGKEDAHDVPVSLKVDDEAASDQTIIDTLPANSAKTVALFAKLHSDGFHSVTASIPADHLPADDQRTIVVRGINQVRILLVSGETNQSPRDWSTFFLKHILQPVPLAEQDQYWIKVTTISPAELEDQKFDSFDCVIMADVADFTVPTLDSLAAYLTRGGGLMIFPGAHTQPNFYNALLLNTYHFLPASLGEVHGDASKNDVFFSLQNKNFEHPIASIWFDAAAGSPAAAHFYRAFTLIPAQDALKPSDKLKTDKALAYAARAGAPRVVLRYGKGTGDASMDNRPAVMERTWGQGRVILFSSSADSRWTDLPARPGVFAPLVYRSIGAIVARQDEALNIRVGEKFIYHPDVSLLDKYVLISKPPLRQAYDFKDAAAKNPAPDSRKIDLSKEGDAPVFIYDQTDQAGVYTCKLPDTSAPILFAAQPDSDESSLEDIGVLQLEVLGRVADVVKWSPGMSMEDKIEKERTGAELWLPLAVLALFLALTETAMADWFSRSK